MGFKIRKAPRNNEISKNDNVEKSRLFNRISMVDYSTEEGYPVVKSNTTDYRENICRVKNNSQSIFDHLSENILQTEKFYKINSSGKNSINPSSVPTTIDNLFKSEAINLFFQAELQVWTIIKKCLYDVNSEDICLGVPISKHPLFTELMTESLKQYIYTDISTNNYPVHQAVSWIGMCMNEYISFNSDENLAFGDVMKLSSNLVNFLYDKVFKTIGIIIANGLAFNSDIDVTERTYVIMAYLEAKNIFSNYHDAIVSILEYMIGKHKTYNEIYEEDE